MDNAGRSNSFGLLSAPIEAALEIANLPVSAFGLLQKKVGDAAKSSLGIDVYMEPDNSFYGHFNISLSPLL